MKINFAQVASFSNLVAVLVVDEELAASSKLAAVQFAKTKFGFTGKASQAHIVPGEAGNLVLLVGAGKMAKLRTGEFAELELQKLGGKIVNILNGSKLTEATVFFACEFDGKGNIRSNGATSAEISALALGAKLASYRFNKYFENKKADKELKIQNLNFATKDPAAAKKSFRDLELITENVFLVRDLVSEPSNILNPESYAEICQNIKVPGLEIEVLGKKEMTKLGMNALLGVGQGSAFESKLVVLKWMGAKNSKQKPLAFVGKGVTFDTGGISIKPANNMEDMKTDMTGSAVVVGLLKLLAQRKARVNVVGVIGLVENMPSGTAQRPGDVVRSMSGQTIEVINTDAEGRLVLADALHYTKTKFNPEFIVDLATLTGAIVVALADVYGGLFCNDNKLAKDLEQAGDKVGELLWRMPLSSDYDEMINSDIADMKNVGSGRGAGSATAAQFLKRFIGDTKWAHLDIAGVAWKGKGDALATKGATGFGLRLLNQLVTQYEKAAN